MSDVTERAATLWSAIAADEDLTPFEVAWRMLRGGRLVEKLVDDAAAEHGLTVAGDYEVLAALRRMHPNPAQPAALSNLTMVSTSGMTGRLDRLEAEGFLLRQSNAEDRRAVDIVLTKSGRVLAEKVFRESLAAFSNSLSPMGKKELVRLAGSLRTVLEALGDGQEDVGVPGG